jgi:plastocyanin
VRVHLVAGLALCAVLAACGGGGAPRAGGTPTRATSQPSPSPTGSPVNDHGTKDVTGLSELSLELDDVYFEPTFLKARPGQRLSIELENEGSLTHTFTAQALGVDETLQPGAKETVQVTLPSGGGDVAFFCRFHVTQGMRGAFFFGASPSAAAATGSSSSYRY